MNLQNLVIYPYIRREFNIAKNIITRSNISSAEAFEALSFWVSNRNFKLLGLFPKPPVYENGVKKYVEYYGSLDPDGIYNNLAIKESWSDIVEPRNVHWLVPAGSIDTGLNTITFTGDLTNYLVADDNHTILDGITYDTKSTLTVSDFNYNAGNDETTITYLSINVSDVTTDDIITFESGVKFKGIQIDIEWYDNNGDIMINKTITKIFDSTESANYEYDRRLRTINQLISGTEGTQAEPYINTLYNHYKTEIDNYVNLGEKQAFLDAINNEVDPDINAMLDYKVYFADIDNNITIASLRDRTLNGLYTTYK